MDNCCTDYTDYHNLTLSLTITNSQSSIYTYSPIFSNRFEFVRPRFRPWSCTVSVPVMVMRSTIYLPLTKAASISSIVYYSGKSIILETMNCFFSSLGTVKLILRETVLEVCLQFTFVHHFQNNLYFRYLHVLDPYFLFITICAQYKYVPVYV